MVEKPKRVLVCIDKFKHTLTQKQAASIIAECLQSVATIDHVMIADGGEDFLEAVKHNVPGLQEF